MTCAILDVAFSEVRPDPQQPRKVFDEEHLQSIEETWRERGQLTPARVRRDTEGGPTPYIIVDGECRWRVGHRLNKAEPNNTIFAAFRIYVSESATDDILVEQYIANSGKGHTPLEKLEVLERLQGAGVQKNKLRQKLGIPPKQFRQLKEFMTAPTWLRCYGAPVTVSMPTKSDSGALVLDDTGRPKSAPTVMPPLQLTHLAALARFACHLTDWVREQQAAHPDGEHRNIAQTTTLRLADKAVRDSLPVERLTKMCDQTLERIVNGSAAPPLSAPSQIAEPPFVRDANGALRIPITDPHRLSDEARMALARELETLLATLQVSRSDESDSQKSTPASPPSWPARKRTTEEALAQ